MSKLNRAAYVTAKNLRYPDNTSGDIQPSDNRDQQQDANDSFINELDQEGSGRNSGYSGGLDFPEALVNGASIVWDLANRLNGFATLSSGTAAIAFALNNFRSGTERILRVKKTISGDIVLTLSNGDGIDFFDFYGNAISSTLTLSGGTNSYFVITFRNFYDHIFFTVERQ